MKRTSRFRPRPNYFWVIVSTSILLFLIGLFGFFSIHSNKLVNTIKEDIELVAELKAGSTDKQHESIMTFLSNHEIVKEGSVKFISRDEGLSNLQSAMGIELLPEDMPNPLFDVITFNLKSYFAGQPAFEDFKNEFLASYSQVEHLYYQTVLIDQIFGFLDKAWWGVLAACSLLTFLALILMHNTIRIALYDNRYLIRNMELVGASWAFISRPFLSQSLKHAIFSLLASFILIASTLGLLVQYFPTFSVIPDQRSVAFLVGFLIFAGLMIHLATTWFYLRKYLKMHIWEIKG